MFFRIIRYYVPEVHFPTRSYYHEPPCLQGCHKFHPVGEFTGSLKTCRGRSRIKAARRRREDKEEPSELVDNNARPFIVHRHEKEKRVLCRACGAPQLGANLTNAPRTCDCLSKPVVVIQGVDRRFCRCVCSNTISPQPFVTHHESHGYTQIRLFAHTNRVSV